VGTITITSTNEQSDFWQFVVKTSRGTVHDVVLHNDYYHKLTSGRVLERRLTKKSFAFLLNREPATAIMDTCELQQIEQYVPDYLEYIRQWAEG